MEGLPSTEPGTLTEARTDPTRVLNEDALLCLFRSLSLHDLAKIRAVSRRWRALVEGHEMWRKLFPEWCIGDRLWRNLVTQGPMSSGQGDWVVVRGDSRGSAARVMLARDATTAHFDNRTRRSSRYWREIEDGAIRCFGVWWFDTIALFPKVPAGGYYIVSVWIAQADRLTHRHNHFSNAWSHEHVEAHVEVGEAGDDGYITSPRFKMDPLPVLGMGIIPKEVLGLRNWIRLDFFNIPVEMEGDSVRVSLRDVDCNHLKGDITIGRFELFPQERPDDTKPRFAYKVLEEGPVPWEDRRPVYVGFF